MKNLQSYLFSFLMLLFLSPNLVGQTTNFDFNILDLLINKNDDTRKPTGGSGGDDDGSGGAGSNVTILTDWPKDGKMVAKSTMLNWESKDAKPPFTISVINKNSRLSVYSATVNGNSINIPLNDLNISDGGSYQVQVKSKRKESKTSTFEVVSTEFYNKIISAVKSDEKFESATLREKISMKSFALEINELKHAAYQKCSSYYMYDDKDDMIMRNLRDRLRTEYGIML